MFKIFWLDKDQEIIDLIVSQQIDKGFKLLVGSYHQKVYWQVRCMVLIHEDADDVTQNIFIKIFQHLKDFRSEAKLSSWIYRIAYNESINFIQKRAKEIHQSAEDYTLGVVDQLEDDQYYSGEEIDLKLQKAIAQLPEKQRVIFMLKYYDEMKYEEISSILDTSVGGLKASYHHAVKKIEQFIKESD